MRLSNKLRILIVDDDGHLAETLADGLRSVLREAIDVDVCFNGESALLLFNQNTYDLMVCDFKMPKLSGLELIGHIHADYPDTVSILMTAYGTDEVEREARLIADAYLPKPFELAVLVQFIQRLLQTENTQFKRTILVLEDNPYLCNLIAKVFKKSGFEVTEAFAVKRAGELIRERRFDALIADINLPDGLGIDLIREYRDKLSKDRTSVILTTGEGRYRYMEEELGVDMYLEKPVSVQDLLLLVNRLTNAQEEKISNE